MIREEEAAVLAVSMTPALNVKAFVVAELALAADAHGERWLNLPYMTLVTRRYGPMIAPPIGGLRLGVHVGCLAIVGRLKGFRIPDEPLPVLDDGTEA
ncbi:MAG: hypothetical protein ACLFMX_02395 [Halobacteriales archaeon]